MPRSKHFLFALCGPQIPFTWCNAYWDLWVEPTRSWKGISSFHPCQPFSYGHLGWILNTKKDSITWMLSWRNNGYKISSTVYWISSQYEIIFAFVFFTTRLLCLKNFKTLLSLYGLPLASVMLQKISIIPHEGQRKLWSEEGGRGGGVKKEAISKIVGGCLQRSFSRGFE